MLNPPPRLYFKLSKASLNSGCSSFQTSPHNKGMETSNRFKLTKEKSRRYPAHTINDAYYAEDIALQANTAAQADTLPHSLKWAAAGIGFHVNADKTEYMCFDKRGNISTLNGSSMKLVNNFTYLEWRVSSTEKDMKMRRANAWTAIDWLSVIWKPDLNDKIKRSFFQAAVFSILVYGCTVWTLHKRLEKKLDSHYTRILRAILNKSSRQQLTKQQL